MKEKYETFYKRIENGEDPILVAKDADHSVSALYAKFAEYDILPTKRRIPEDVWAKAYFDYLRGKSAIKIAKELKNNQQKRSKEQYFDDVIYLDKVSDLLHFGIFDIFYTKPEIVVDANDDYKSSPMNEYIASVEEGIRGYVELNSIGKTLIEIFDK